MKGCRTFILVGIFAVFSHISLWFLQVKRNANWTGDDREADTSAAVLGFRGGLLTSVSTAQSPRDEDRRSHAGGGLPPERTRAEPWRWFGWNCQRSDTLWRHELHSEFTVGGKEREITTCWWDMFRGSVRPDGGEKILHWSFLLIFVKIKSLFFLSLSQMKLIDISLFLPFVIVWKGLNCITCKWRDLIFAHYLFISENEQNISGSQNEGGGLELIERDRQPGRWKGGAKQKGSWQRSIVYFFSLYSLKTFFPSTKYMSDGWEGDG